MVEAALELRGRKSGQIIQPGASMENEEAVIKRLKNVGCATDSTGKISAQSLKLA